MSFLLGYGFIFLVNGGGNSRSLTMVFVVLVPSSIQSLLCHPQERGEI